MKNLKELEQNYKKTKKEIKKRLEEFEEKKNKEEIFIELCFCICTPLSKAKRVIQVINEKNKNLLLKGSEEEIAKLLKGYARFQNNKAKFITEARKKIGLLEELPKNSLEARDYLTKNFKGLGLKEASHFLRNIGYKDLAILDKHIISCLHGLKVIKNDGRPATKKQYEEISEDFKNFSKKIKIPVDELDLLFWSSKTGCILK